MGIPDGTIASSARSEGDRMFDPHRTKLVYERDAEIYCRSLPLEHFMESTTQSTQRKITLESLDLVTAVWPEFQVFSELLIQYPVPGEDPDAPARVVPDNMVIVHSDPIDAVGSFMTPIQPVGPILVLEYVSNSNKRKDNEDNRKRYERDLRVPYYLLYDPDEEDLTVFRMVKGKYVRLKPNEFDRLAIPYLELEVAVLDGWVRYWFRGELLPLPGDLLRSLNAAVASAKKSEASAKRAEASAKKAIASAESERDARMAAERAATAERTTRLSLEAEIARLRAELSNTRLPPT